MRTPQVSSTIADIRLIRGLCSALASDKKLDWVEVTWPLPSGAVERFSDLPIDRYITVVEGEGKWK